MKQQFLSHIQKSRLCSPSDKILLAVSGGLDSMVMLDLFVSQGFVVSVTHCNFQLRANDSDEDALFVESQCAKRDVPCQVKRFNTAAYAEENKISIQMAARELRYAWFQDRMRNENFSKLATAHHLNDNLETVLMNLARGTELKGIPEMNDLLIRPLLHFSRQQIEAYARENEVFWREDSSNASDDYQRNYIRNQVIPLLKNTNTNLEEGFERTYAHLQSARELADRSVEQIKQKSVTRTVDRLTIRKDFGAGLKHATPLLWELIREFGFNFTQCGEIVNALYGESGTFFLSPGYRLVIDRDELIITKHEKFWQAVEIREGQEDAVMGAWMLTVSMPSRIEIENDNFVAWLDKDLLTFPLTWRVWDHGDFFYPLGMVHRKKLSDFMIDRKMSVADKDYVTVLESAGEIVWVVGYRIDNRFKITPATKSAVKLTLDQYFT